MKILKTKYHEVMVDDEDYEWVKSQGAWHINNMGYAIRFTSHGYINGKQQTKTVLMHRFILNAPKGMEVDHIDNNPLNNQKSNLRLATHKQNMHNSKMPVNNKSGYIGVSWRRDKNKWRAEITKDGKHYHLGYFSDILKAVEARDRKAKELHGEFAQFNIVTS